MNKEIRERKRRFLAGMLILALVFGNIVIPTSALATGYNITDSVSFDALDGNIVWPGDTITYKNYTAFVDVTYLDKDGTQLSTQKISIDPLLDPDPYTVSSYTGSLTNFEGWEVDFVTGSGQKIKSMTFRATGTNYVPVYYTINYHLDGGTNDADNPSSYEYGYGVNSFKDAVKENYSFEGWYTDADFAKERTYISSADSGTIDMYAKFKADEYKIDYKLDGGSNSADNPTGYAYGEGVAKFEDAVKEGYTFEGWYSDAAFTTPITEVSKTQTGDVTLYAKYKVSEYGIAYELDGGTNAESNPANYTYGVGVEKFEDAVKEGYTFEGWYSDAAFTTKVTSIDATQTGDVTLYAKYKANEYGIVYELDGGTNAESNPTNYTYGVGVEKFEDAVKEGYTFEGWYSDAAFTTKVTSVDETQTGDVTLYAKYKANEYGIVYELDGGINAEANPTNYTYGVGVVSFEDAAKEGYTFEGWYSDAVFTTKVTSIDVTQTGEVTLYAKFVKVEEEVKEDKKVEVDKKDKKDKKDKQDTANIGEDTPKTGAEADEDSDKSPETGDNAPIEQMYLLMLLAGVGMFLCRKKKAVV